MPEMFLTQASRSQVSHHSSKNYDCFHWTMTFWAFYGIFKNHIWGQSSSYSTALVFNKSLKANCIVGYWMVKTECIILCLKASSYQALSDALYLGLVYVSGILRVSCHGGYEYTWNTNVFQTKVHA